MFKYSAYVSKEIFCLWQFKKKIKPTTWIFQICIILIIKKFQLLACHILALLLFSQFFCIVSWPR